MIADLRNQVEAAPRGELPELAVAECPFDRLLGELLRLVPLADRKDAGDPAQQTEAARKSRPDSTPRCGRTSAATSPPAGIAVCRIPSASPRCSGGNQCMTARPLAELTLAPAGSRQREEGDEPARSSARRPRRPGRRRTRRARRRARPARRTGRPRAPTASSVSSAPTHSAASMIPISESVRPKCVRIAGARAGEADPDRREARLRGRAARQHDPAVRVAALQPERVERPGARRDEDALRLEVQLERLEPELPAEAGLLVAAERDSRERRVRHVDPDRARP